MEFVAGSEFQAVAGLKLLKQLSGTFKAICEAQHKDNEVEFEVFLNDYEGVQEALRSVEK